MRSLSQWDAEYLDELAGQKETASFERKASDGLTKEKIAQGVCAFANTGEGFMVFGLKDEKAGGGLDDGVPAVKGRQPIEDWAEALIPVLHQLPIEGCEARFIHHPTYHQPDRGVLAIAVPLSERRPHWCRHDDKFYLRAGAHSTPMPTQIFADMLTRGSVPRVDIADSGLGVKGYKHWYHHDFDGFSFPMNPVVWLKSGPICEIWACEIRETDGAGEFRCSMISQAIDYASGSHDCYIRGNEPLFPTRKTLVLPKGFDFRLCVPSGVDNIEVAIRVYAASAPPFEKRFAFSVERGELWAVVR